MVLVHRQALGATVELPGGGVNHDRVGGGLARRLDQPHLRHRVHRDVGQRVLLAAHVAGLGGQVEDDWRALAERPEVDVSDIAANQLDRCALQVGGIGPAAEQKPVERRHPGAARGERVAEIGAEKPGASGDQHLAAFPLHPDPPRAQTPCSGQHTSAAEIGQAAVSRNLD